MNLQALCDVVELFLDGRAAEVFRQGTLFFALLLQQLLSVLHDFLELLERLPMRHGILGLGVFDRSQRGQDGLEALYQALGFPSVLHDIVLCGENSAYELDDDGHDEQHDVSDKSAQSTRTIAVLNSRLGAWRLRGCSMIRTLGHHLKVRNGCDDRINTRIRAQGRATRVYLEAFPPLRGCRNLHRTD